MWQVQLDAIEADDRTIEFIVDTKGNSGKTAWGMYHQFKHDAIYIPPVSRGIDVCSAVINKGVSSWYIVDTPRAFEFTPEWAVGLEQLKNGYVFDTRNSFKDLMLPCRPRITVLCNQEPDDLEKYFSKDRLIVMQITPRRVSVGNVKTWHTGDTTTAGLTTAGVPTTDTGAVRRYY